MTIDATKPMWSLYPSASDTKYDASQYPSTPLTEEQHLYENLVVELCDVVGTEVEYYMLKFFSNPNEADPLYGENAMEIYDGPYSTKIVYTPTIELSQINIFGITSQEEIQFMQIPKYTFSRDVSAAREPQAGDLIRTKWNTLLYSITDVGEEANIFLSKKMVWEFIVRPAKQTNVDTAPVVDELTNTQPLSAWGDSSWIEENKTATYTDLPNVEDVYGYK